MRIQVLKFDVVVVFSLTKRINGLDLAFGGHDLKKECIKMFVVFCKYLKIYDDPTAKIWTHSRA